MSSFEVARDGDRIVLTQCAGAFGLSVSQWSLSVQEAEQIIKFLGNAVESMKLRARSPVTSHGLGPVSAADVAYLRGDTDELPPSAPLKP